MDESTRRDDLTGGKAGEREAATCSDMAMIGAGRVMLDAVQQAREARRDPARMLRVLSLLAAPVCSPRTPYKAPIGLDLRQEWHVLAEGIRRSAAPILLARLTPPTLAALRAALSLRAKEQNAFPHVLHFSGHAWSGGLVFEDDLGQVHSAITAEILKEMEKLPQKLDLVVLNGCESAADAGSVAQALVEGGLARAVVGHEKAVRDDEAVAFASRLYVELTGGFALGDAVERAKKKITTHKVILLGERDLRFEGLGGGKPLIQDHSPRCSLSGHGRIFLGRGPELVQISRALAHPPAVVVLSGPQGIGKSSLAVEAARRNAWRFSGGLACAAGPRPEEGRKATALEMLNSLAEDFDLSSAGDLLQYAAAHPALLLMDNLESLEGTEMERLKQYLQRIGDESAVIMAMRPSFEALVELPTVTPVTLHSGLALGEATRYAWTLAGQKNNIHLNKQEAYRIARAVDGHPLLVEQLVALAGSQDLDELLDEVEEKKGNFAAKIEKVYSWSAARLDPAGLVAWKALLLFPAGSAPESVLKAASGEQGPQKLREAALADFDPSEQLWRWHATVAEYAGGHWPIDPEELRSQRLMLLTAWNNWLKKLPTEGDRMQLRLESSRHNLAVMAEDCTKAQQKDAHVFLDELEARLPMPDRTLTMKELVEMVWKAKLILLPEEKTAERAKLLNNLGNALSNQGRLDEALRITEEAAVIYRNLAKDNPDAFLLDLATTLSNLGVRFYNQGAREKALDAVQEAVDIQRNLNKKNPNIFMSCLARSLSNLSSILSAQGRKEEALDLALEAATINKQLAESNPLIFLPDLAISLYNLSLRLSELNQKREALDAVQKAMNIYRQLVKSNSQAFIPDLAASLNNLSGRLSDLGRLEEALAAAQESVNIRRKLVKSNPPAFLTHLAASLNNLGKILFSLKRGEEALAAVNEAVAIRSKLAQSNPPAFLPDLAMSLNNLSLGLSSLNQGKQALATVEDAVAIRRKLVKSYPSSFLPDLAMSLQNQGLILYNQGKRQEALNAANEAVEILRQQAKINPKTFLPHLANSLGIYGSTQLSLEHYSEAAQAFAEGLEQLAQFQKVSSQAFTDLVNLLKKYYMKACQKAGQEPDRDLLSQLE